MDNNKLQERFSETGKEYKYDAVNAEFTAFKDFKVRWQRSYKWAEFKVSDYMADAPAEVIDGLAKTLFTRICDRADSGFPKELCDWVTAPEFSEKKQPIYLKRSRNLTKSSEGEFKDLRKSYSRLEESGLVEDDPSIFMSWTKGPGGRKAGQHSVLMKVIAVSSALDGPDVPEFVVDYVVYHELCHLIIGFDPTAEKCDKEFDELESRYPRRKEAGEWLRKTGMYL